MSAAMVVSGAREQRDQALCGDLQEHLDAQLESTRRLLAVVLEQGAAIRARDVAEVVRLAGILRGEMGRRELLEEQRTELLARSGDRLSVAPTDVTLRLIATLMSPSAAERASASSAELRGLLAELARQHATNRALMQLELGFLDHLMGLLALDGVTGYDPHGSATAITRSRPADGLHALDLRA